MSAFKNSVHAIETRAQKPAAAASQTPGQPATA
jgi:hypothetical protein